MRRMNGEGSISKTANGRFRAVISVREPGGKLRRISRVCRTRAGAVSALQALQAHHKAGESFDPTTLTVGEYLHHWLATVVDVSLKVTTRDSYRTGVEKHLVPYIGQHKLAKLHLAHIQQMIAAWTEAEIGPATRLKSFTTLKNALAYAITPLKLLRVNPCAEIKIPPVRSKDINPFEAHQVNAILEATRGTRWHALYHMAFSTGMRSAELLGLRWSDVDLPGRKLHIRQTLVCVSGNTSISTPKTAGSRRTIPIPAAVVESLYEHRAILLTEGNIGNELVFCSRRGLPQKRTNFDSRLWRPLLQQLGLAHRGFHHTRHTFATLALSNGAPLAVVSKMLGHSSQATTLLMYSHALPSQETAAIDAISKLIG